MPMRIRPFIVALVLFASVLAFPGCTATVGDRAKQDAVSVDTVNRGPTSARMIDNERGSLTLDGAGPGRYTHLTGEGVETQSTGITPRTLVYDAATGRLVLDSGSDMRAKNVEVRPDGDGRLGLIKIGEFSTISSEPTRAANEAYDRLAEVWLARDQASRDVLLAELEAIRDIAPDVVDALSAILLGL